MLNCKFDRVSQSLYSHQSRTPLITNRRNGKSLFLSKVLAETQLNCEMTLTPDEPRYIKHSEVMESGPNKASVEEAATATTPDYYNGEFIKATALLAKRGRSVRKVRKLSRKERSLEETVHSVKSLKRQCSVDLLSSGEQETVAIKSRPRANAFCEMEKAPCPLPRKQTAPVLAPWRGQLGIEVSMSDTEDATHFESSALFETRHISSSYPTLKYLDISSPDYLTILPSEPVLTGKQAKRPVPTPRSLPPHQHPTTTPPAQLTKIHHQPIQPTMKVLPPPLPAGEEGDREKSGGPRGSSGMSIRLHYHRRSLSEVTLHSCTFSIDAALYVNMQDLHDRHDELPTLCASVDEVKSLRLPVNSIQLPQRGFDRQKSSSMGDIYTQCSWGVPSNELKYAESFGDDFSHTEQIYENGQHFMNSWMYDTEGTTQQEQQPLYCNWDSGIESTPNSSPFENTQTFSTGETEWYSSRGRGEEKATKGVLRAVEYCKT